MFIVQSHLDVMCSYEVRLKPEIWKVRTESQIGVLNLCYKYCMYEDDQGFMHQFSIYFGKVG